MYNASLYGGIMGNFLLNELGEVLLEIQSHLDFGADMCLEVSENSQTAILKSLDKKFNKVLVSVLVSNTLVIFFLNFVTTSFL